MTGTSVWLCVFLMGSSMTTLHLVFVHNACLLANNRCPVGRSIDITPVVGRP